MTREQPPLVPWVVEGLVVSGCLTLLSGREGVGKSMLAASLAVGVAVGESVADLNCKLGKALIVDGENGRFEIHRRIHTLGVPPSGFEIVEAEGFSLADDLDELERLLREVGPNLLVLDSFRSLWPGGEENKSEEVAAVLDPLRNLIRPEGVGTFLLHHPGKNQSADYRGNSAIGASVELGFKLGRHKSDPESAWRRELTCWKCRPAPEPEPRWVQLRAERGQVFVDPAEPFESGESDSQRRRPVLDELAPRLLDAAGDPIAWPELARKVGREPDDRTARRLRDELLETGELRRLSDGRLVRVAGGNAPIGDATLPPRHADESDRGKR